MYWGRQILARFKWILHALYEMIFQAILFAEIIIQNKKQTYKPYFNVLSFISHILYSTTTFQVVLKPTSN